MPKVEANGINIFYEYMGDGDPLALIGGSLFGRQNFAMVWEGLAKNFNPTATKITNKNSGNFQSRPTKSAP